MNILLFAERSIDRARLVQALASAGDQVDSATDSRDLVARLTVRDYDLIVLSWTGKCAIDMVRCVRARLASVSLLAVVETPEEAASLVQAGVDELLRRPLMVEEIKARVRTMCSLRTLRAAPDLRTALEDLPAWSSLPESLARQLEDATGWRPNAAERISTFPLNVEHVGDLLLSVPQQESEIRVRLMADLPAGKMLAGRVLLDSGAGREQCDDMMRELTNVVGACVKRMLTDAHIDAVTGLPTNRRTVSATPRASRSWRLSDQFFLGLVVDVVTRPNLKLPASRLAEGMVLVRDLNSEAGALLVPAGTCLTSTTAERVRGIVGDQTLVEVAAAP